MECESPAGLLRYVGYFTVAAAAFASSLQLVFGRCSDGRNKLTLLLLAAAALAATWWHLGGFLWDDYTASASYSKRQGVLHYLCSAHEPGSVDLFTEAYRQVSASAAGWRWSSSLLHSAFATALLLRVEGARAGLTRMQIITLLVLDFSVANSVALCLFLAATDAARSRSAASANLGGPLQQLLHYVCYLGSAVAATVVGLAESPAVFVSALSIMHGGLLLPVALVPVQPKPVQQQQQQWSLAALWGLLGAIALASSYFTKADSSSSSSSSSVGSWSTCIADVQGSAPASVRAGFASHCQMRFKIYCVAYRVAAIRGLLYCMYCIHALVPSLMNSIATLLSPLRSAFQSSISYDYVFTLAAALYYVLRRELHASGNGKLTQLAVVTTALMPVIGVGAVLPFYMAVRELQYQTQLAKMQ
eukprot:20240-Heterococcus_DN1.PRE.1